MITISHAQGRENAGAVATSCAGSGSGACSAAQPSVKHAALQHVGAAFAGVHAGMASSSAGCQQRMKYALDLAPACQCGLISACMSRICIKPWISSTVPSPVKCSKPRALPSTQLLCPGKLYHTSSASRMVWKSIAKNDASRSHAWMSAQSHVACLLVCLKVSKRRLHLHCCKHSNASVACRLLYYYSPDNKAKSVRRSKMRSFAKALLA